MGLAGETSWSVISGMLRSPCLLVGIIIFLAWAPAPSLQNHYCSISKDHTLCKFQGVGPRCKNAYEIGIPAAERKQILHLHNYLRQMVANGGEGRGRPGPQPSGGNMLQMEWDDELALSAQRLAEQCKYTHDCLNCRKVDRFLTGQNLYQFSENLVRDGSNWEQAIMAWYDEVARFNPRSVDYFEFIKELGHYTQMLWAETYKVGCGYAYYKDGKWNRKLYVCNYGPAGNVITTEMYKRGAPCSACPEGTFCSNQYPGLCSSGRSSHSRFPQISAPQPTTRRPTTTTTRRTTTTTTTTTTTPSPSKIIFNEIESNEIDHFQTQRNKFNNDISNNGLGIRFGNSGRPHQQQTSNRNPFPTSSSRFSTNRNTGFTFSRPVQTTTTRRPLTTTTTTRRPTTTTTLATTKKSFTFSPRITFSSQRENFFNNNGNSRQTQQQQQQINDNRISPLASGTIQIPQTQRNRFTSTSDHNRFSSKPTSSFGKFTTNNRGGSSSSSNGLPNAKTEILRIKDSPAYSIVDTNSIVLFCDFDYAKCPVRSFGPGWNYTTYQTPGFGKGFATVVESGKRSSLEVRSVMYPEGDGSVCLYFRFVNFIFGADGGPPTSFGGASKFFVTVTSAKQTKKSVEIAEKSSSALDWLTARVQFTGMHSMFLLAFDVPRNSLSDNVYLAIDDILITKGLCHV